MANQNLKVLKLKFPDGFHERLLLNRTISQNELLINKWRATKEAEGLDAEIAIYENQRLIYEMLNGQK